MRYILKILQNCVIYPVKRGTIFDCTKQRSIINKISLENRQKLYQRTGLFFFFNYFLIKKKLGYRTE